MPTGQHNDRGSTGIIADQVAVFLGDAEHIFEYSSLKDYSRREAQRAQGRLGAEHELTFPSPITTFLRDRIASGPSEVMVEETLDCVLAAIAETRWFVEISERNQARSPSHTTWSSLRTPKRFPEAEHAAHALSDYDLQIPRDNGRDRERARAALQVLAGVVDEL